MSKPRKKKRPPKRVLALPDLEQSKAAVLNTLTSKSGQRSYDRAIERPVNSDGRSILQARLPGLNVVKSRCNARSNSSLRRRSSYADLRNTLKNKQDGPTIAL